MAVISQEEMRGNLAEVLRRAEGGEEIIITDGGRPIAQLGPATPRRWVSGQALRSIWAALK